MEYLLEYLGMTLKWRLLFRYVAAKPEIRDGVTGWEFRYVELPDDFDTSPYFYNWEPHELSEAEFILVNWLCNGELMDTKSNMFEDLLEIAGVDEDSFIRDLRGKKLVYKDEEDNLNLLTDECVAGIKHGRYYAGEYKHGKMMRWLLQRDDKSH